MMLACLACSILLLLPHWELVETTSPFRRLTPEENADVQQMCRNAEFMDSTEPEHKITHGQQIPDSTYYPWAAALQLTSGPTKCGATLISPLHLITARHCLDKGATMRLMVGGVCLETNEAENCPTGDMIEIEVEFGRYKAKFNDDNDHSGQVKLENSRHDLAILQLREGLNASRTLHAACLPNVDRKTPSKLQVYGWGLTQYGATSSHLMLVFMNVLSAEEVASLHPFDAQFCSDERLICMRANDTAQDANAGDSGSGIVAQDPEASRKGWPLLYGTTVRGLTEAQVNVATRTQLQLIDICYYTGVCVKKEWVDEGVDALESQVFVKFDTDYIPRVSG